MNPAIAVVPVRGPAMAGVRTGQNLPKFSIMN
jgi:hypothetical protein